jgi:MATE family multidrug resistance protein
MLGQLGHVLVGLADSIMIGKLGTIPLAASAFANSVFVVPMVFGMGMAFGLTPPIANAHGAGKTERVGGFLKHALVLNMATALLVLLCVLSIMPFSYIFKQEASVESLSMPYLVIISSSIFPLMLFLTFKQFAEGLSDTRFAMLASIGANLLNVGLNYLLIYGHFGFPALGLNGAGYATTISRIVMAAAMFFYVFKNKKFQAYLQHFKAILWEKSMFKRLLEIGLPSGIQYIFEVSAFAGAAIIVGQMGAEQLAAHQIAISLAAVSYMAASGLGAAASVRTGNQMGRGDFKSMRMAGRSSLYMVLIFMACCGLLLVAGNKILPGFYSDVASVKQIASSLLYIAALFQLSDGVQVLALGALRGIGDTKIPTYITLLSYWIIGIGLAYCFGIYLEIGPLGVWYGLAIGLTVAAVLLYGRFEQQCKKMIHAKTA